MGREHPGTKKSQGKAKKRARRHIQDGGDNLIIAVDFDGILCENKFPSIGKPNYNVISFIRQLIDDGHEVVLWTTRNGDELTAAVDWCGDYGLHFCNVNAPAPSNEKEYKDKYPTQSRKIYADIYIDDHNLEFVMNSMNAGFEVVEAKLRKGVKLWKKGN